MTTRAKAQTKGVGTGPYMAPEVYDGDYSEASDMWAFGMVVYEVRHALTTRTSHQKLSLVFVCLSLSTPHRS